MPFYRSSRRRSLTKTQKIIISCAITGAIHTPSMSPYLPVTPDQIAEASIGAAKAGAAISIYMRAIPRRVNQTTVSRRLPHSCHESNSRPTQ
jgi:hypothetical protein